MDSIELWDWIQDEANDRHADVSVRLEAGGETAWSCELRWTPNPNVRASVDLSVVFYATGLESPEEALSAAVVAFQDGRHDAAIEAVRKTHEGLPTWR